MPDRPAPWATTPAEDQATTPAEDQATTPAEDQAPSRRRRGMTLGSIAVGIVSGLVVLGVQSLVDGWRTIEAERRDNIRFVRELVANDKAQSVSLRGIDLQGRDLSGLVLGDVDWADANMSDATLRGLGMPSANLGGANFSESDLYQADLSKATMVRANLSETNLQNANLSEARIVHSDFSYAVFEQTDLSGAHLGNSNFEGAQLTNVLLNGTDLNNANLSNSSVAGLELSVDPFEVDFIVPGPILRNTDLSGSTLRIDLRGSYLDNTKLYGADLSMARLPVGVNSEDKPSSIWMDKSQLPADGELKLGIESICYDRHTQWPADFPTDQLPSLQCDEMKD